MSVASEITRIKGKVADSFAACEAKGATIPESEEIANLPTCIDSIPAGSSANLGTKEITANGTYNAVDDSLDGFSAVTVAVEGGSEPIPTDGKTHAYITLTIKSGLALIIYFMRADAGTMYIDWGDGTAQYTSTATGALNTGAHIYADYGDYEITMWVVGSTATYMFANGSTSTTTFGGSNQAYRDVLTKIFIGEKMQYLGSEGFYYHHSLSRVEIPSGIILVGQDCFYNCYSLKEIILPATITMIGASAFYGDSVIKRYVFLSTTPPALSNINAFASINSICKIYVPDASLTAYKTATNWVTYAKYIYPISEMV